MKQIEPTQPEIQNRADSENPLALEKRRLTLRERLRTKRSQLSDKAQILAEHALIKHMGANPVLLNARKVASYMPLNGEISPRSLEQALPKATIHYPCITNYNRREMRFYTASPQIRRNAFGINEPIAIGTPIPAAYFDVILVPLVAFDRQGNRLGMGAGFYDRALSLRLNTKRCQRPRLIGLAHHFQEVKSLTVQSWDVPLDAILTDFEFITST